MLISFAYHIFTQGKENVKQKLELISIFCISTKNNYTILEYIPIYRAVVPLL